MYISPDELIQAFSKQVVVNLSNDDYQASEPNRTTLEQAIIHASERIDAALRSRYRLPLSEVPTLIRSHALTLARHWLYGRRPDMPMPERIQKDYEQAIKELEQIANGRLHLGIAKFDDKAQGDSKEGNAQGDLLPDSGEIVVRSGKRIDTGGY